QRDQFLIEPNIRTEPLDPRALGALHPPSEAAAENREAHGRDLSGAGAADRCIGPGEKCCQRTRRAARVPKIEVVRGGIVEVDGALYQPQAEKLCVKIQI